MKRIILAINMALPLILAAWPQELTAEQKSDEEKFNDLAAKFAEKVEKSGLTEEETKNFAQKAAEKLYPGLLATGSGSKAKNEELFAQINQELLAETSADLFSAILKAIDEDKEDKIEEEKKADAEKNKNNVGVENTKELPPPAPSVPARPDPSPTIRLHNGPAVSTTPTAMEVKHGVKFDQQVKNTQGDHIKLKTTNVLNMLHDLHRHSDATDEQKELAAAAIEVYEKGLALALTIFK